MTPSVMNLIYQDEESGLEFEIPYFENIEGDDLIISYKDEVIRAIYSSLVWLGDNINYGLAPCFSLNGYLIEIESNNCEEQIDKAIEYFTSTEEYEKCVKLISLKKRLQ